MSEHSATAASAAQASAQAAARLSTQLVSFLAPLLRSLDQRLDRRLASIFLATLIAIVEWRNRNHGLLLSGLMSSSRAEMVYSYHPHACVGGRTA